MKSYDFDPDVQKVFLDLWSSIPLSDWKKWLDISSREEYECTAFTLSGLSAVNDFCDRMKTETTDPRSLSVDVESLATREGEPVVVCHTSGTSGGHISDVKWFHISDAVVRQLWAPGMQAIFEASGLDARSCAVVFVPSRTQMDGMSVVNGNKVIKVYSAEFSQRLVLALVNPLSYVLHEYKNANSVQVLTQILSMEKISVVSAPFTTVLGWATLERLRKGIEKSLSGTPEEIELTKKVDRLGVKNAAREIQEQLSTALKNATFIFSTTGMTEREWNTIRTFLRWEKGAERVTNLYVGSEIGPFAASIDDDSLGMHVFPLTVPVIEKRGNRDLMSRSVEKVGTLFVSRMHGLNPVMNIDTGDVITIKCQDDLPVIQSEVLRAGFRLKTDVTISSAVGVPEGILFVGTYFDLDGIEIRNPRQLITCLLERCHLDKKSSVVVRPDIDSWVMILPRSGGECSLADIQHNLSLCPGGKLLETAIKEKKLQLNLVEENPVESKISRAERLEQVRKGNLPKGVLKRWPLYVVVPFEEYLLEKY